MFSRQHDRQELYSVEYMIEKMNKEPYNRLDFDEEIHDPHIDKIIARNVLEIGSNDYCPTAIASDGKVFSDGELFARTILEYIYGFCERIDEKVKWL